MCLAIPGQVEELFESDGLRMARVNFGGVRRVTCLEYVPGVRTGDFVLVHVGFALSIINQDEAERTLNMLKTGGELSDLKAQLETSIR